MLLPHVRTHVARHYTRGPWVAARCHKERDMVLAALDRARHADTGWDFAVRVNLTILSSSGLLAVALLRPPTHRMHLVLLRDLLHQVGQSKLHEQALAVCGFADLSASQVSAYLETSAHAFDRAVAVRQTPSTHLALPLSTP